MMSLQRILRMARLHIYLSYGGCGWEEEQQESEVWRDLNDFDSSFDFDFEKVIQNQIQPSECVNGINDVLTCFCVCEMIHLSYQNRFCEFSRNSWELIRELKFGRDLITRSEFYCLFSQFHWSTANSSGWINFTFFSLFQLHFPVPVFGFTWNHSPPGILVGTNLENRNFKGFFVRLKIALLFRVATG